MDIAWPSDERIELLRAAWPAGHMPMQRAWTIGGFVCTGVDDDMVTFEITGSDHPLVVKPDGEPWDQRSAGYVERGELLPNVDPSDHATWATVLADLAQLGLQLDPNAKHHQVCMVCGFEWLAELLQEGGAKTTVNIQVQVKAPAIGGGSTSYGDQVTVEVPGFHDDPAVAVLLAFAVLRRRESAVGDKG